MEGGPDYNCLMVDGRPVGGAMALVEEMGEGVPPHWNVYFNVTSTDQTVAQAAELGGTVVTPAFDVPAIGRMAVLAYHSLEDRMVKNLFREGATDKAPRNLPVVPEGMRAELMLLTRGAEKPGDDEVQSNPRAASARLRVAERTRRTA